MLFDTNNTFVTQKLIALSGYKLLLPLFHTISDSRLPHISNLYPIRTKKMFLNDIDTILQYYHPIALEDITKHIQGDIPFKKPVFHLTFDDGLCGVYNDIAPILEQKGISATFFINSAFVDNKALFYRYKVSLLIEKAMEERYRNLLANHFEIPHTDYPYLKNRLLNLNYNDLPTINHIAELFEVDFDRFLSIEQPYLTSNQVRELVSRGFTIGSHTVDHPFFNHISLEEQKRQIAQDFEFMHSNYGIKNHYFSFPFSDIGVTTDLFDWLNKYEAFALSFGTSGLKHDTVRTNLHRLSFDGETTSAEHILRSSHLKYIIKLLLNKNKIKRK